MTGVVDVKLMLPCSGLDKVAEVKTRLSPSASLARPPAVSVSVSPMLTVRIALAGSMAGAVFCVGAAVTVTMIDASARRPCELATVYLHLYVPVAPFGGVNMTRSSAVRTATPPLPHTGSAIRLGLPPDGSLSFANTSMVTGLPLTVSPKSSAANGARGSASTSTVTVTLPVASLPCPSLMVYENFTGVGSVMSGRLGVKRTALPSTAVVPAPSDGEVTLKRTTGSWSGSTSFAVTAIFTELPITTRSASAFATGGRLGAVSASRRISTLPSTLVVETSSINE